MSYFVLARKYRPQRFEDVVQQDHVTRVLCRAIIHKRIPHALIFAGSRGTGKTSMARILAKALNCSRGPTVSPCQVCQSCLEITSGSATDVYEIDGASSNRVNQVRELRDDLKYLPINSRYKIYIIDEAHMLTPEAFNALLKIIEEPPSHVIFIFATTEWRDLPATILSRCQRHDFRRINAVGLMAHMKYVCNKEQIGIDKQSLSLIAREAEGSIRDALGLLEHVLSFSQSQVSLADVSEFLGLIDTRFLFDMSAAILARDVHTALELIHEIWRAGFEIQRFYSDLLVYFHQLVLVKLGTEPIRKIDLSKLEIEQMKLLVGEIDVLHLIQIADFLLQAEFSIKSTPQTKFNLEMIVIKLLKIAPAMPLEFLIEKLKRS